MMAIRWGWPSFIISALPMVCAKPYKIYSLKSSPICYPYAQAASCTHCVLSPFVNGGSSQMVYMGWVLLVETSERNRHFWLNTYYTSIPNTLIANYRKNIIIYHKVSLIWVYFCTQLQTFFLFLFHLIPNFSILIAQVKPPKQKGFYGKIYLLFCTLKKISA